MWSTFRFCNEWRAGKKNASKQSFIDWLNNTEPYIYAYTSFKPDEFLGLTLDEAAKVTKGVEIKIQAEDYRWNGQMQILRWIGSVIWNKPVSGYKKARIVQPERLFSLPGDKKEEIPLLTKGQFKKAVKKAKLLKGWQ